MITTKVEKNDFKGWLMKAQRQKLHDILNSIKV